MASPPPHTFEKLSPQLDEMPPLETAKEQQARTDFITWSAEILDGSMRTPTEFHIKNNDVVTNDGSSLRSVCQNSLNAIEEKVKTAPQLKFELRRQRIEATEPDAIIDLVNSPDQNVMIVVSDFPEELMHYPKDVGGYNVTRKQALLRVITHASDGSVQMLTQSLDQSNRKALEAIYQHFGVTLQQGELLGQRITASVDDPDNVTGLVDQLTAEYDNALYQQTGVKHNAGRQCSGPVIDTYIFAMQQHDIVRQAVQEVLATDEQTMTVLPDERKYKFAALMEHRYTEALANDTAFTPAEIPDHVTRQPVQFIIEQSMGDNILLQELEIYGRRAVLQGKNYSACGGTLSVGMFEVSSIEQIAENGYGEKVDKEETYGFDSFQYCVDCQAPPEKDEDRKWCGPCGLCKDCDKKHGGKG